MSTTLTPETVLVPAKVDEVSVVLELAADLIEEKGWYCKDFCGLLMQQHCPGTAINEVTRERPSVNRAAFTRLRKHLGIPDTGISVIPAWNDAQTDSRVVIRALRQAAASS